MGVPPALFGIAFAAGFGLACQRSPSLAVAAVAAPPGQTSLSSPPPPLSPLSDEAPRWAAPDGSSRLAEDPAAGQRAVAEWRRHLAAEDRERLLARDRHVLHRHRAIVTLLERTRRDYERARSDKAVAVVEARITGVTARVERLLASINVWGNVSPLTATYRSLLVMLRQDFPHAALAARAGATAEQRTVHAAWARQLGEIEAYLREAAASEGEGE
jgi:hypothetical protein